MTFILFDFQPCLHSWSCFHPWNVFFMWLQNVSLFFSFFFLFYWQIIFIQFPLMFLLEWIDIVMLWESVFEPLVFLHIIISLVISPRSMHFFSFFLNKVQLLYNVVLAKSVNYGGDLVAQSLPTLCNPMNWILLGSSICGILQVRILEWVALSLSRAYFWPRNQTHVSSITGRFLTNWATRN